MSNQLGPYTTEPTADTGSFTAHFRHTADAEAMRAGLLLAGVPAQAMGLTGTEQDRDTLAQALGHDLTVTDISEEQFARVYAQLNRLLPDLMAMGAEKHAALLLPIARYSGRHSSLRVAFPVDPGHTTVNGMPRVVAALQGAGISCEERNEMPDNPTSLPYIDLGLVPGTNLLDNIERMVASRRAGGNTGHAAAVSQTSVNTALANDIQTLMNRSRDNGSDDRETVVTTPVAR